MKILELLIRVGFSLSIAFAISFSSAVIYFGYTEYENRIDRFMLVTIPTLAIGFLLFEVYPKLLEWLRQRNFYILITFAIFSLIVAIETVLSVGTSRVYWMGTFAYTVMIFFLILPAIPSLERLQKKYFNSQYGAGFLLSFVILYILIGFVAGTLEGKYHLMAVTAIWLIPLNIVGYYLMRHVTWSLRHGFLKNWLNIFLILTLPIFVGIIFYICLQFPSMFQAGFFQISSDWFDVYLSSAVVSSAWGLIGLEQIEKRGWYEVFRKTKLFSFIKENIAGIYAGTCFFFINLILARAINHPTFSFNSIIFEADAGPWFAILGLPEGYNVNRAVHPLTLITIRPFVRFIGLFLADKWFLAPMLGMALISGSAVLMAWVFIKRAVQNDTHAFIFSTLLGASASHLLFGSVTETYVFGMASLVFFIVLVQANEKRLSVLVPAGLLVFGITITNIAQSMIALFFKKFGFWRLVYYGVIVLTAGITLTAFVNMLFPGNQSSFWVPEDILFEAQFSRPVHTTPLEGLKVRAEMVGRNMFLYNVLAPTPIEGQRTQPFGDPLINFKTYEPKDGTIAWYEGVANFPLIVWMIILIISIILFMKNIRSQDKNTPLLYGILGGVAFNFVLHMNYGTELFLYTSNWTFLIVFFVALSLRNLASRKWFQIGMVVFLLMMCINNVHFLSTILRGLAPYLGGE
jgi:hypothetical protein